MFPDARRPSTIGSLRASGYADQSVKDELRTNLLARLRGGAPLFPSIVGFDDSVLPALERGILAGHDLILLGERGQAKTRLIRHLVDLLETVLKDTRIEEHRTRTLSYRGLVLQQEDVIVKLLSKLGHPPS